MLTLVSQKNVRMSPLEIMNYCAVKLLVVTTAGDDRLKYSEN